MFYLRCQAELAHGNFSVNVCRANEEQNFSICRFKCAVHTNSICFPSQMACSVWRWRSLSARGPWWPRPPKELSVKLPSVPWGRRGASFVADVQSSGVSDSLRPCELSPTRLLCPWDFPDRNTGVDCHFLLQRIFPTLDQTHVSCVGKWILYRRATGKPGSASG